MSNNSHNECQICFEQMNINNSIELLCCHQNICSECLEKWKKQKDTCPFCRNTFTPSKNKVYSLQSNIEFQERKNALQVRLDEVLEMYRSRLHNNLFYRFYNYCQQSCICCCSCID